MDRALREFRIRGVATNIAFVENLLKHPTFLNEPTPPSSSTRRRAVRVQEAPRPGTKILTYIADITVNGHPETAGRPRPPPT
jgi:pyruvate carboxylase